MRGQIRTVMGVTEWTLLFVLGALWGGSYFFGKVALSQLPPFTVAVCRLGLAAVVLHVVVRAAGYGVPGSVPAWRSVLGHGPAQQRDPDEPDPVGTDHGLGAAWPPSSTRARRSSRCSWRTSSRGTSA